MAATIQRNTAGRERAPGQIKSRQRVRELAEVYTHQREVEAMLDLVPSMFPSAADPQNTDRTFLEPACGSGNFLEEILRRKLAFVTPRRYGRGARYERRILRCIGSVYGIDISMDNVLETRERLRALAACHRDPDLTSGTDSPAFASAVDVILATNVVCGDALADEYRVSGMHPTVKTRPMRLDVIVGNPPYQIDSDGSTRTKPVYHRFVEAAIAMDPRYVVMITPSRWFAGGLGLGEFRVRMLNDRRIARLVDYRVEKDAFPDVNVNGGVSFFLWDAQHDGPCQVTHVPAGGIPGSPETRYLDEFDLLVRQNEGVRILRKVRSLDEPTFDARVSAQKPFDLHTNFHGAPSRDGLSAPTLMHGARRATWVPRADLAKNVDLIDRWKVFLAAASDGNETFPSPIWDRKGPFVGGPGEICSGSYLVVYPTDRQDTAEAVIAFLRTRFVRFLVSLRKITQHNDAGRFAFVPDLAMDRVWTDAALYERYGLTDEEIAFIESEISATRPGPLSRSVS